MWFLMVHFQTSATSTLLLTYVPGPCQFPTLGFVVNKWNLVQSFVPESFWYIHLALTSADGAETPFNWRRNHIYDQELALCLYDIVMEDPIATVVKVTKKSTKLI
jgi:DNA topoisomerase III